MPISGRFALDSQIPPFKMRESPIPAHAEKSLIYVQFVDSAIKNKRRKNYGRFRNSLCRRDSYQGKENCQGKKGTNRFNRSSNSCSNSRKIAFRRSGINESKGRIKVLCYYNGYRAQKHRVNFYRVAHGTRKKDFL